MSQKKCIPNLDKTAYFWVINYEFLKKIKNLKKNLNFKDYKLCFFILQANASVYFLKLYDKKLNMKILLQKNLKFKINREVYFFFFFKILIKILYGILKKFVFIKNRKILFRNKKFYYSKIFKKKYLKLNFNMKKFLQTFFLSRLTFSTRIFLYFNFFTFWINICRIRFKKWILKKIYKNKNFYKNRISNFCSNVSIFCFEKFFFSKRLIIYNNYRQNCNMFKILKTFSNYFSIDLCNKTKKFITVFLEIKNRLKQKINVLKKNIFCLLKHFCYKKKNVVFIIFLQLYCILNSIFIKLIYCAFTFKVYPKKNFIHTQKKLNILKIKFNFFFTKKIFIKDLISVQYIVIKIIFFFVSIKFFKLFYLNNILLQHFLHVFTNFKDYLIKKKLNFFHVNDYNITQSMIKSLIYLYDLKLYGSLVFLLIRKNIFDFNILSNTCQKLRKKYKKLWINSACSIYWYFKYYFKLKNKFLFKLDILRESYKKKNFFVIRKILYKFSILKEYTFIKNKNVYFTKQYLVFFFFLYIYFYTLFNNLKKKK